MSRSNQFIGLNSSAEEFVHGLKVLQSDSQTEGMFDEPFSLRKWESSEDMWIGNRKPVIREIVQDSPWSSGPMIFTCLEIDYLNGACIECFQWIRDPRVKSIEFDKDKGRYWV
jgi:hypothetical protein